MIQKETSERWFHVRTFITYIYSAMGFCLPLAVMASIKDELKLSSGMMSEITGRMTYGSALGKIIASVTADSFGAYYCLMMSFLGASCAHTLLCYAEGPIGVSAGLFLFETVNGVVYPALTVRISNWWRDQPESVSNGLLVLSLASRLGSIIVVAIYAQILSFKGWRELSRIVVVAIFLGIFFVLIFIRDTPEQRSKRGKPFTFSSMKNTVSQALANRGFRFILATQSMCTIWRRFDGLLTIYLADTTDLDETESASYVSVHSLGYLMGLFTVGFIYKRLEGAPQKWRLVGLLYFVGFVAICAFTVLGHGFLQLKLFLIILGSFCSTLQYYIIPATLSVEFGASAGFASAMLDMVGYIFSANMYSFVLSPLLDSAMGWKGFFYGQAACWALNYFFMMQYMTQRRSERND